MKKKKIAFIALFAITITASSQKISLNLHRSIEIATTGSLQAFRLNNMYLVSYWEYRSFKAGRLPSLSLRATPVEYRRDFTRRYDSEKNIDVYRRQQTLFNYGNLSISQNLDLTGGTFFIDSELGYMKNFKDNIYSQFNSVPLRIGYSQGLMGFNRFKWERKIEPLKFEKAKKQFLSLKEEIAESVIERFFNVAIAQMEYNIAKENITSANAMYYVGQERFKIASLSQSDLLTLRLDSVNARNDLVNAGISLKRAMFGFLSLLNMEKETQLSLELPEQISDIKISPDSALAYARSNNPGFLEYKQEIMEAEREVERTKKGSDFDASISLSTGFNQIAGNFLEAYKNPLQQDVISIGLTIPIMDWGLRKGRANMARNNLNVARISVTQKELALEQEVIMTVSDFNVRQQLIQSAHEAVTLAKSAYDIVKERFIIGKSDLNSVTLSLNRQNTAQRNYIAALRDYWLGYYKLRKLTLFDFLDKKTLSEQFDKMETAIRK